MNICTMLFIQVLRHLITCWEGKQFPLKETVVILWNFTTKKHKVDDYILILCAFFHRIHIQNTGIIATYRNIIMKSNYVVTPAQYKLRPVSAAFMFVMHQICNEKWWMMLLNKISL